MNTYLTAVALIQIYCFKVLLLNIVPDIMLLYQAKNVTLVYTIVILYKFMYIIIYNGIIFPSLVGWLVVLRIYVAFRGSSAISQLGSRR